MAEDPKTDEIPERDAPAPEREADAGTAAEAPEEQRPVAEAEVGQEPEAPAEQQPGEAEPAATEPTADADAQAPAQRKPRKRLPRAQRPKKTRPQRPATTGERRPIVRRPKPETPRGRRQERRGVVVSDAADKTIVVKVDTIRSHPKYKKVIRRSIKFHAHDERNAAHVGDVVRIVETRPLSKTKHWRLAEIVEVAK
jgi:small subunit ribosomal protein S17